MRPEEKSPGRLLVVGHEAEGNRLCTLAKEQKWQVNVCKTDECLQRLRRRQDWDAVVLCPGASLQPFVELCRQVKLDQRMSHLPVVWVLVEDCGREREEALLAGADDCVAPAATQREVALRLARVIRAKKTLEKLEDSTTMVVALANAVEGKDAYTCGHVERVGTYAVKIGARLGLGAAELDVLKMGGIVHDIGKIGVPDHILNKPDKLEPGEMLIVRRHPLVGHDILKDLRMFREVLPIVRWHHERPNGTGYPDGLDDAKLPLMPRIVAAADCFDALTTNRPYRPALSMPHSQDVLSEMAERGDLDKTIVAALLSVLGNGVIFAARPTDAARLSDERQAPAA